VADTDNQIEQLQKALTEVLAFLNKTEVSEALSKIPASIKTPVFDGLKKVLDVIKTALDELKKNLGSITTVKDLLKVINDLLTAAEGLAPNEKDNLENLKKILNTLQSLPDAAKIEAIIVDISKIIAKLESL
jgi:Tfp pilus assembly protein PilO